VPTIAGSTVSLVADDSTSDLRMCIKVILSGTTKHGEADLPALVDLDEDHGTSVFLATRESGRQPSHCAAGHFRPASTKKSTPVAASC
jgi:hypothetical protein